MLEDWLKKLGWTGTLEEAEAKIRAALFPPVQVPSGLRVNAEGWLVGKGVKLMPSAPSWYGGKMKTSDGKPQAIVAHYSATKHGTAISMAKKRLKPYPGKPERLASWHVSIDGDGLLVQQVPFINQAWHAGKGRGIPDLGNPNACSIGIELVGHGDEFPLAQVEAAKELWRVLVKTYPIERKNAHWQHSTLDPDRRKDPGPVWMENHATAVLDYAFTA